MRRRLLLAGVLLTPCARAALAQGEVLREDRDLMGTRVRLMAPGRPADLRPAFDAAWHTMQRLERTYSRFRTDSLVNQLANAAGGPPRVVPNLLVELLAQARHLAQRSQGALDVTVGAYRDWQFSGPGTPTLPSAERLAAQRRLVNWREVEVDGHQVRLARAGMRLDLGALAKLPILEAGLDQLRRHGVRDALVDGGGDVAAMGQLHGRPWQVGVRDPRAPDQLLAQLPIRDAWVVSSGDYERCFVREGRRYHHILDPRSGLPSTGLRGVTLVGADWRQLNGLGTALMVAGAPWVSTLVPPEVKAIVVGPGA